MPNVPPATIAVPLLHEQHDAVEHFELHRQSFGFLLILASNLALGPRNEHGKAQLVFADIQRLCLCLEHLLGFTLEELEQLLIGIPKLRLNVRLGGDIAEQVGIDLPRICRSGIVAREEGFSHGLILLLNLLKFRLLVLGALLQVLSIVFDVGELALASGHLGLFCIRPPLLVDTEVIDNGRPLLAELVLHPILPGRSGRGCRGRLLHLYQGGEVQLGMEDVRLEEDNPLGAIRLRPYQVAVGTKLGLLHFRGLDLHHFSVREVSCKP
mmetsp:Transcript_116111/g.259706  ORF Transcript_116111/g.259706 Transcript_116111/m.259706 type:complete len:268 (-) Transcript_116111:725-1528(-)